MSEIIQRLAALLVTIDQLIEVLETENKALAGHRPDLVARTVDRKLLLGRTFERQMQQIGPLKDVLARLTEKDRRRVVARIERFRNLGQINQIAIDAARRAAERVVGHIIDAVRKQNNRQPTRYARPTLAAPKPSARPLSVNLNQVF